MITNRDLELLSAYADGELSDKEVLEIEQRIKLSPDLQDELAKLQKLKGLVFSSARVLPESPYLETRVMAAIHSENEQSRLKRWAPALGIGVVTVFLMIFLKYNPNAIDEIVKEQHNNIAGFYKENLKPLLFAADLSNEDIFNFAFYHQLPLDKNQNQVLQLGYSNNGQEFFEIKHSDLSVSGSNYDKFMVMLNLNDKEKKQMDSILESYKDEIELQVLANEKNTIAINPNLWNYNKAIAADLISFVKDVNDEELAKLIPIDLPLYDHVNVKKMVSEVKSARPNQFIFLTPDTIFSEEYVIDMQKMKEEVRIMNEELRKADKELRRNVVVNFNADKNLAKMRKDSSWEKNFTVHFDSNFCRVQLSGIEIPPIRIPVFHEIAANIEEATRQFQNFTVAFPKSERGRINVKISGADSMSAYNFNFNMPNLDSITHFVPMHLDSAIRQLNKNFNMSRKLNHNVDSLVSKSFNYNLSDSIYLHQNREFQKQMRQMEMQMRKFQEEMENLRKDLNKDSGKSRKKQPIEI